MHVVSVDSIFNVAVKQAYAPELVTTQGCQTALEQYILQHPDIHLMTAHRLATHTPEVVCGSNHALQKLMAAVRDCYAWKAPAQVSKTRDMQAKKQLDQTRLKFMTYNMMLVDFFTVVGKSTVRYRLMSI
jgi:hypothetical protein